MVKSRNTLIADIRSEKRLREDVGDLHELAVSIDTYGLLHPIIIDSELCLVAGFRRLKACQILGHNKIATRDFGDLTLDERQEIELEENVRRKDLNAHETMKVQIKTVETARQARKKKAAGQNGILASKKPKCHSGRPEIPGSDRDVAKLTGISRGQQQKNTRHNEIADAYPFMQDAWWNQMDVLRAGGHLDKMTKADQKRAAKMIADRALPVEPKVTIKFFASIFRLEPESRKYIFELHKNGNEIDKSNAFSLALEKPLEPDFCALQYLAAIRALKAGIKFTEGEMARKVRADLKQLEATCKDLNDARTLCNLALSEKIITQK